MTLPDATAEFSALPAQRIGLIGRGVLKQGMWADVAVSASATLGDKDPLENPGQLSEGTWFVPLDAVPVIEGGLRTGALPGKVRRRPVYVP